jgi:hypothetical protein
MVSATEMDVLFSEAVAANSAQNISNYSINNGIGNPLSATVDANDDKLIHLVFATNFPNGQTNILSIQNIADLAANIMLPYNVPFTFYVPQRGDIVINEFLADPTPQVNLPNDEYVELKNNMSFPVTLNGWKFSDAATTITLPNFTIPADSYVVICKTALIDSFITRGFDDIMVVGLNSLPSLNNSNDDLTLYDNDSNVIDFVSYALSWYGDALKDDGGWSLERIDPTTPCGEGLNWRASLDANGGTPGKQNSVFGSFTDRKSTRLNSSHWITPAASRMPSSA